MEVRRRKPLEDVQPFLVGPADHKCVVPSEVLQLESRPAACAEGGMYEMCVLDLPVLSTDGRGGSSKPVPVY
jgi:hypothetical protein